MKASKGFGLILKVLKSGWGVGSSKDVKGELKKKLLMTNTERLQFWLLGRTSNCHQGIKAHFGKEDVFPSLAQYSVL